MYINMNLNPRGLHTGDCVIRGIALLEDQDWDTTFIGLCFITLEYYELPDVNDIWREYLRRRGYSRHVLENSCPYCYTVKDFCRDHPEGRYLACTGEHVVAVINGNYYDTHDTGDEIVSYFYKKEGSLNG